MKIWFAAAALSLASAALGADGKALFEANGCTGCHDPAQASVGPRLTEIAAKYEGKKGGLLKFLEGKAKPIVAPGEFAVMKPNLAKTTALSEEERAALADFLLSHRKK